VSKLVEFGHEVQEDKLFFATFLKNYDSFTLR